MLLLQQKGDAGNDWQCHLDMYLATVKQNTEGPVEVEKSDHVPDRILAERIGRAKGRAELAGSSVPADLIIEIKETALRASIGPCFVWKYRRFVKSLPSPPRPLPAVPFSALGTRPPHVPSTGVTATPSNTVQPAELENPEIQLTQTPYNKVWTCLPTHHGSGRKAFKEKTLCLPGLTRLGEQIFDDSLNIYHCYCSVLSSLRTHHQ